MSVPTKIFKRILDWRHRVFIAGGNRFRKQRFIIFQELLLEENDLILDLGYGYGAFEDQMAEKKFPNKIIALDLVIRDVYRHKNVIAFIRADAGYMPFAEDSIDLIFCNSLIEHVGDWSTQFQVFQEITRVSRKFYLQTPNKHFPIELHHLVPFFQYLPRSLQNWIGQKILGHYEELWLLNWRDASKLAELDREICLIKEKIIGITKSFVLYRN
jgi:SAM-dependent methyltransferase